MRSLVFFFWSSQSVILYLLYEVRYGCSFTLLSYLEVLNYLLVAGVSVFVFVYEPFLNCNILRPICNTYHDNTSRSYQSQVFKPAS